LVVFAEYHLNMVKQMNNARSARKPTPLELLIGNKKSLLLPHPQVNNQATPGKSMTTSERKYH
jgi:hypothetical protein